MWGAAGEAESSVIAHWLPTRGAWRGQPACGGWCGTGRGRRVAASAGAGARTRTRTSAAGGLARAGVAGTQRRGKCPKIVGSFRNGFEITQTHSTLFGSKAWPQDRQRRRREAVHRGQAARAGGGSHSRAGGACGSQQGRRRVRCGAGGTGTVWPLVSRYTLRRAHETRRWLTVDQHAERPRSGQ